MKLKDRWIIYFDSAGRTAEYLEIPTDLPPGSILKYLEWHPLFHLFIRPLQKSEIQYHFSLLSANQIADTFLALIRHVHFSCPSFHNVALAFMEEFWGNLVGSFQLFLPLLFFKLFPILHQDLRCCWQFAWNGELQTQQRDINKK